MDKCLTNLTSRWRIEDVKTGEVPYIVVKVFGTKPGIAPTNHSLLMFTGFMMLLKPDITPCICISIQSAFFLYNITNGMIYRSIYLLVSSAKETSMQCNFCHKEITEGGYVWLNKQWCVISHVEPHAGAGLPHICNKCSISLSKKEIIQELMKQHPAHKHAVESIIERCKREGYGITFSNQEIDDLLGLKQPAHCSREEREDFKFERKQGLDNIKRDLLYNYNLRFTGTKKTKKGHGGWCVRHC